MMQTRATGTSTNGFLCDCRSNSCPGAGVGLEDMLCLSYRWILQY
jgi:hypothetical protein